MAHFLLAASIALLSLQAHSAENNHRIQLCPHIVVFSPSRVSFSRNERNFLCGDENSEAWRRKPLRQLRFHGRAILQSKGFHSPTFMREGNLIIIQTGTMTRTRLVEIKGLPKDVTIPSYRRPIGRPLTPQLLDQSAQWLRLQLAYQGYPCVHITESANPRSKSIHLKVRSMSSQPLRIQKILEPEGTSISPAVFERYRAFRLHTIYDEKKFEITNRRIDEGGIAEASQFRPLCESLLDNEVQVEHMVFSGAPHSLRLGIGLSSDEYILGRIAWQPSRLGALASSLSLEARGSFREQSFRSYALWYFSRRFIRLHLRPTFEIVRESEDPYTSLTSSAQILLASHIDFDSLQWTWKVGPQLTDARIFHGTGLRDTQYISLHSSLGWMSHDYEYFRYRPRDGWAAGLHVHGLHRGAFAPITALKTSVTIDFVSSLRAQDPKLLVMALRGRASSAWMEDEPSMTSVPLEFKQYLGGRQDLRGFARKSLPSDEVGAFSTAFASLEFRTEEFLIDHVHPLILFDLGALGQTNLRLKMPLFASAGGGFRWESPFGVLRATVARGFVWGRQVSASRVSESIQFHASVGEEF